MPTTLPRAAPLTGQADAIQIIDDHLRHGRLAGAELHVAERIAQLADFADVQSLAHHDDRPAVRRANGRSRGRPIARSEQGRSARKINSGK